MEVEPISLLDAFRLHYSRLTDAVHAVVSNPTDPIVIERLCNDLSEYTNLVNEVCAVDVEPNQTDLQ